MKPTGTTKDSQSDVNELIDRTGGCETRYQVPIQTSINCPSLYNPAFGTIVGVSKTIDARIALGISNDEFCLIKFRKLCRGKHVITDKITQLTCMNQRNRHKACSGLAFIPSNYYYFVFYFFVIFL